MNKKTIIWIIVVLAVIAVVAAFIVGRQKSQPVSGTQPVSVANHGSKAPALPQITLVSDSQIPTGLPDNLPWEKVAQVIQNFTSKDPVSGKVQSTRVYVSSKTMAQNLSIYQKYLSDNGWTLTTSAVQPTIENLDANKGSARLDITIGQPTKGQVTVNVSMVQ
jgi:hypothetical protein